jgi:hypothetical protein
MLRYEIGEVYGKLPWEMDDVPAIELVKIGIFWKVREERRVNERAISQAERAGEEYKKTEAGMSRNVIGRKPDPDEA